MQVSRYNKLTNQVQRFFLCGSKKSHTQGRNSLKNKFTIHNLTYKLQAEEIGQNGKTFANKIMGFVDFKAVKLFDALNT